MGISLELFFLSGEELRIPRLFPGSEARTFTPVLYHGRAVAGRGTLWTSTLLGLDGRGPSGRTARPARATSSVVTGRTMAALLLLFVLRTSRPLRGTLLSSTACPFANIAHGCNSKFARRAWRSSSAILPHRTPASAPTRPPKKFLPTSSGRLAGLRADAARIVATVPGLKYPAAWAGAGALQETSRGPRPSVSTTSRRSVNASQFKVPALDRAHRYPTDTDSE